MARGYIVGAGGVDWGIAPVIVTIVVVAFVVWAVRESRKEAARRRLVLGELSLRIGAGPPPPGAKGVSGRLRGQPLTFRYTTRGSGKHRHPWTEVDVEVPPGPLSFALRAQTTTQAMLRDRGLVVDVETGDEIFDDAFIVEAAPADVARALLDEELRGMLLAARPFAVVPREGQLRVEVPGHALEPARAMALVELAARLAAGVRPAHAAADAALEAAAPREGAPYRAEAAGGEAVRAAKRARLDEVARLEAVKQQRVWLGRAVAVGIVVVLVVTYAGIMLAAR
jgi:hypothetical protein